jgi:hypothetical protein
MEVAENTQPSLRRESWRRLVFSTSSRGASTWVRPYADMRYFVASLFAALQLLGFIFLAGAGHGWVAGAWSCLPLAPISFVAWFNALRAEPSRLIASGLLVAASGVLAVTAFATLSWEGTSYFLDYWRVQGTLAGAVIALLYVNWIFACGLTWWQRASS